jgi:5-formyltetrahydrofolate cyclo-ligase
MDAKRMLRERLVAMRAARPAPEVASSEAGFAEHGLLACQGASIVAAYAGIAAEPPTHELLDRLVETGIAVVLPVIDDTELRWAPYSRWDDLVTGPFGLLEPAAAATEPVALADVDIVLAPSLAVDLHGNRLGRGKGYFDRALRDVEPRRVIAVVYDDELLPDVPVEAHDRPVGAVLTPSGLRRLDG